MTIIGEDYDYSADVLPMRDNILSRITGKAHEFLEAQQNVELAEAELAQKKEVFKELKTRSFPELMSEAGQKKVVTSTNLQVEVKDVVRASIPEDKLPEALAWLKANGQAGVIKNFLEAELGRGQEAVDNIKKIIDFAASIGVEMNVKESVHHMTLSSLVKELLKDGKVAVPMETLGAWQGQEVSVKPVKSK